MSLLSSLTNRIFLASALLVVVSIGVAMYRVNVSVARQAEADLRGGLAEAASLVDEFSRTQFADFVIKGSLIADLPVLKAAAATDDPPTVEPIAARYQRTIRADLFVVIGRTGDVLARAGRVQPDGAGIAAIVARCRASQDGTAFWPYPGGVLHAVAIPMEDGPTPSGTLLVGFGLDRDFAERIRAVTASDIALVAGTAIIASTLDGPRTAGLAASPPRTGEFERDLAGERYIGRAQALGLSGATDEPLALVLRSRTEHLRFLSALHWQIGITAFAAVLLATLVGYLIARTVTRPVRALTATMREIATTGDLARKAPAVGPWDDEDARLLATTFAQLTGSLDRFQREAAQRERLSSLGRLSTVIAHEVRNPLMIIKSAIRNLRKQAAPGVEDVAASIDEEVNRLNRVVTGVLDFARPIRFDLAPADLITIAREAAHAAASGPDDEPIAVETAERAASAITDAERLRSALVNLLNNAQHAVRERPGTPDNPPTRTAPRIGIRIARADGRGWRLEVFDRGIGVAAEDLPRLFEPFFTTRRTGSGLGLALARNIIEGLGGTIAAESRPATGTTIRIVLPAGPTPEGGM